MITKHRHGRDQEWSQEGALPSRRRLCSLALHPPGAPLLQYVLVTAGAQGCTVRAVPWKVHSAMYLQATGQQGWQGTAATAVQVDLTRT